MFFPFFCSDVLRYNLKKKRIERSVITMSTWCPGHSRQQWSNRQTFWTAKLEDELTAKIERWVWCVREIRNTLWTPTVTTLLRLWGFQMRDNLDKWSTIHRDTSAIFFRQRGNECRRQYTAMSFASTRSKEWNEKMIWIISKRWEAHWRQYRLEENTSYRTPGGIHKCRWIGESYNYLRRPGL